MYCPQCGQERVSEVTSFCSRCGFLLTGTAELLKTGGMVPQSSPGGPRSPRSRGIRLGLFMFLLTFVIAPIVGIISTFGLGIDPWPVGVVIFLLGVGGILRMIYALMFESKDPHAHTERSTTRELNPNLSTSALPPQRDLSATEYTSPAGTWREPETKTPNSVTENTTRLLEKD